MLSINNISVGVKDSDMIILNDLSLNINDGEIHAIMGPNGTGKSTLSKVIMGHYRYKLLSGDIIFNGENINSLTTDKRAKMGIFIAMQDPISVDGVSNSEFLKSALSEVSGEKVNLFSFIKDLEKEMNSLELDSSMLHRSLNEGFSGGERKKNEILQLKVLKPKFIILDEIDSGLDIDSLRVVCDNINEYLSLNKDCSLLIITHYPRILKFIKPDYVHVMKNGTIVQTGSYSLALDVEKNGYNSINDIREEDNYA